VELVQVLLPLTDNLRHPFPRDYYDRVALELTERFGGVTAYTRARAEGRWKHEGDTATEEMVVIEVMVAQLDEAWWTGYRKGPETMFRQQRIIVRAQPVKLL
jgi:hypothetical protein